MDKIKVYAFKARYYETHLNERVPGVKFKLKNTGSRTLTKVEITVYFRNAEGDRISQDEFHPVLVTEYGMSHSSPLKPGYTWQMESGRFYKAD